MRTLLLALVIVAAAAQSTGIAGVFVGSFWETEDGPAVTETFSADSGQQLSSYNMTGVCPIVASKYPQYQFDSETVFDSTRNRVVYFNQIKISNTEAASYWTAVDLSTSAVSCIADDYGNYILRSLQYHADSDTIVAINGVGFVLPLSVVSIPAGTFEAAKTLYGPINDPDSSNVPAVEAVSLTKDILAFVGFTDPTYTEYLFTVNVVTAKATRPVLVSNNTYVMALGRLHESDQLLRALVTDSTGNATVGELEITSTGANYRPLTPTLGGVMQSTGTLWYDDESQNIFTAVNLMDASSQLFVFHEPTMTTTYYSKSFARAQCLTYYSQ